MLRICRVARVWNRAPRFRQNVLIHGLRNVSQSPRRLAEPTSTPLRKQLKDERKSKKNDLVDGENGTSKDHVHKDWELIVGIEIHAQLNSTRKLFSRASTKTIPQPRDTVTEFDLAIPGSLPTFQNNNLIPALRAALALNCSIESVSYFDRKHYFYHDQPAGYQITQYYSPFAKNGYVDLSVDHGREHPRIGIKQIQMEQDTAKTQEQDNGGRRIDYLRSGFALIEIISLPNIYSPEMASEYVRTVQALLLSVNAVTTGMELGGLRADVNVSVRRRGDDSGRHSYADVKGLGQRTEIKNIGTLKGVEDAVRAERDRQIAVLEDGGAIEGETRGWSLSRPHETRRLRGKEGEVDYRYMPDPDIPPLRIGQDLVERIKDTLPTVADRILTDLTSGAYGLNATDAKILLSIDSGERLDYFGSVVAHLKDLEKTQSSRHGQIAANWVLQELGNLSSKLNRPWSRDLVPPHSLAQIIATNLTGKVTMSAARDILLRKFEGDERTVESIIHEEGLVFRSLSEDEYRQLANSVIDDHPDMVEDIREKGKTGKMMYLVGKMMRQAPEGRIEAPKAQSILQEQIEERAAES